MNQDLSLENAIRRFIDRLKSLGRSNNTIVAYQGDLNQLAAFLKEQAVENVDQIKTELIESFKDHLGKNGYTPKSISRKLNSVKSIFRFLVEEEVLDRDFSRAVKHPKVNNDLPRVLKPMEYRALRDICRQDKRTLAIVELMLQVGLRISEVANLRLDNIKEKELVIEAYESHARRMVPLNQPASKAIEDYLRERQTSKSRYLFVTKTGRQLLVRNIRSILNRYFEKAGLQGVKVNDLRNTFIVEQLSAGVPLDVISRIVGHKRLSTTERYLGLVSKSQEEVFTLKEL
ncbi:MAG: tyrosine-type recombinase/integrase [Patescibacteria group bacterium]|nr:tyrosine-type recombinase/integrase [Patescibacteria group bacterium]